MAEDGPPRYNILSDTWITGFRQVAHDAHRAGRTLVGHPAGRLCRPGSGGTGRGAAAVSYPPDRRHLPADADGRATAFGNRAGIGPARVMVSQAHRYAV